MVDISTATLLTWLLSCAAGPMPRYRHHSMWLLTRTAMARSDGAIQKWSLCNETTSRLNRLHMSTVHRSILGNTYAGSYGIICSSLQLTCAQYTPSLESNTSWETTTTISLDKHYLNRTTVPRRYMYCFFRWQYQRRHRQCWPPREDQSSCY
jgi:hypothetical protein